jgi:hypothetical protein
MDEKGFFKAEREYKEFGQALDASPLFKTVVNNLPEEQRDGVTRRYLLGTLTKELYPSIGRHIGVAEGAKLAEQMNPKMTADSLLPHVYAQFKLGRALDADARIWNDIAEGRPEIERVDEGGYRNYNPYTETGSRSGTSYGAHIPEYKAPSRNERLEELDREIQKYSKSVAKGTPGKFAGITANMFGMMGTSMAASTAAAAINPALGYVTQAASTYPLYRGLLYKDMVQSGIKHEIAAPASAAGAVSDIVIENALGAVPVAGFAKKLLAKTAAKKLIASGALKTVAQSLIKKTLIHGGEKAFDMLMEGGEESLQALSDNLWLNLAAEKSNALYGGVDWRELENRKEDIGENFIGGFGVALTLGLLPVPLKPVKGILEARNVTTQIQAITAAAKDKQALAQTLKNSKAAEHFTPEAIETYAETARDWKAEADEAARLYTNPQFNPYAAIPTAENEADFRVGNNGHLAGMDAIKETGGKGSVRFSDPSGVEYGSADFDIEADEDGNGAINITNIDITNAGIKNKEGLRAQVIRDLAARYPDYAVSFEGAGFETAAGKAAAARILDERETARGQPKGLSGRDTQKVQQHIEKVFGIKAKIIQDEKQLTEEQRQEINKHYIDAVSDAAYTEAKEQGKNEEAARQEAAAATAEAQREVNAANAEGKLVNGFNGVKLEKDTNGELTLYSNSPL